jgi:hypothetical protein
VGVVLYSIRQGEPSPATDQPVASNASTTAPPGNALPTTPESSSPTTVPISAATIEHVSSQELSSFIGSYQIDYQDADLALGQIGTTKLTIEMNSHSFCLRLVEINSSSCHNSADGSTLPTQPEPLSTLMASSELDAVAPLISVAMIAPTGVDLSVLSGDQPVCALQQFPLTQFGTAVVWACQARGPTDHWELAATKDGRTLAAPTFATSPDPSDVGGTVAVPASLPDRPFDLFTHCGINGAMIDGVWWQAAPELNDGNGNPPNGWGNPYQAGVLHFTDDANAIFTGTPQAGSELVANLQRTASTEFPTPLCS